MAVSTIVDDLLEFVQCNTISCSLLTILCVFLIHQFVTRRKNLPPGPIGLPFVGYLPFLGKYPHKVFDKLGKFYGDVYSLYLGQRYVVVLTSRDAIREAFSKQAFLDRPPDLLNNLFKVDKAISTVNGKEWEDQRRFMLQLLRDLGFGKSKMEQHIQEEIHFFMKNAEEKNGKPFRLQELLTPSVSNNITSLVFGERFNYDDPRRILLDGILNKFTSLIGRAFLLMFFPWVATILRFIGLRAFKEINESLEDLDNFIKKEVLEHEATLDTNNIRDYIDGYILQIREEKKEKKITSFDDNMLYGNVRALFGAGSGTIRGSLDWAFLVLATFNEVQRKIQEEISEVVGSERDPCWADRLKMPYTQAFITEVLRWKSVVAVNLARYASAVTTVRGFLIPKGSIVLANFWSVHMNPEYWDEPDSFRPDRFLNKEKNELIKNEAFMSFSVGRRSCPGEVFARIELFLYITSVLQHYNISFPKGEKHDFSSTPGISNEPTPWKVCFTKRTSNIIQF